MIKKEGGTMDRDTIFLYVIAVIASCFGLINCIQFFFKGNKTAQTVGTIISFKTINPENSKFRNSKWATVSYKVNGRTYQSQNCIQVPMASQIGTTVTVRYDTQNPELSYAHYFCERKTKENIYTYLLAANATMHSNLPQGAPWNEKSYVGCTPTQNLVDAYDMKDGTEPITGYDANGQPIINKNSGYDDKNPYENRDPRLKMTIFYHGNTFDLNGSQQALDMTDVDDKSKSSGYLVLKYLDDRIGHKSSGNSNYDCNPQMIRYAEILLGYAETLNELGDSKNAVKTVNLIRKRAGVGELDENKNWNKDELRQRIYKEYRVEFAFEDNRFFDARRWAKAEEWFSKPVYKVTVTGSLENPTYTRSLLEERIFLSKCYHFPIPQQEVDNSQNIEQNAGW